MPRNELSTLDQVGVKNLSTVIFQGHFVCNTVNDRL